MKSRGLSRRTSASRRHLLLHSRNPRTSPDAACPPARSGGGYSYRLAPAHGPLTEATFNKIPLKFVGQQTLRWGGGTAKGGKEISYDATYVTGDAVVPAGSMWAKQPIPLVQEGVAQAYPMAPGCAELWGKQAADMCAGMGDGSSSVDTLEIVDRVLIPKGTPAGEYVLNWRYAPSLGL